MNAERDWESLSDVWRSSRAGVDRAPLRKLVASQRRRLAAVVAGEVMAVAGFAWLSWLIVRDGVAVWESVWLTTLWSLTAIASAFAWWNRRGAWNAMTESVAEYQRQCAARRLRSLRFGYALFIAEVIVVVAQLAWFGRFTVAVALFLGAFGALFAVWAAWMRRQAAREIEIAGEDG